MAGWRSSALLLAAFCAVNSYAPARDYERNLYLSLDNCRADYPGAGCALDRDVSGVEHAFGPWRAAGAEQMASHLAIAVVTETVRGGFGGTGAAFGCGRGGSRE